VVRQVRVVRTLGLDRVLSAMTDTTSTVELERYELEPVRT